MAKDATLPVWERVSAKHSPYTIERLIEDIPYIPLDCPFTAAVIILKWALWDTYLSSRYRTLPRFEISARRLPFLSWLLFLVETVALLPSFLIQLEMAVYLIIGKKERPRPRYQLVGDNAPAIDVFVTCCGEDVGLIMDTLSAAAVQDYPKAKYHVYVLDDGADINLKRSVECYNSSSSSSNGEDSRSTKIQYLSRQKTLGEPHHYKSGNLQHGFAESLKMNSKSEFVAALDADMIAEPDWLRRTVPHLILDGSLALVNAAGDTYDAPVSDILVQGFPAPVWWLRRLREYIGLSTCNGSGYILLCSALEDVGGWPKADVGEDIIFTWLLTSRGWDIAVTRDVLQHGRMPGTMNALLRQRQRWIEGMLLLIQQFKFFIPGLDPASRRTVPQTIYGFVHVMRIVSRITDSSSLLLNPVLLLLLALQRERHDHNVAGGINLSTLNVLYLASLVMDKIASILLFGRVYGQTISVLWMVPHQALSLLKLSFANTKLHFQPTGTIDPSANERSSRFRQPLKRRLQNPLVAGHCAYTLFATCCLLSSVYILMVSSRSKQAKANVQLPFLTGASVWLLEYIFKMSISLRYMIWPPTVPERRELMEMDQFGNSRPKRRLGKAGSREIPWLDVFQVGLALGFCLSEFESR